MAAAVGGGGAWLGRQESGAIAHKLTSSKTGANIQELFDAVVTEVTNRFPEDASGDQPQPLLKMGASDAPKGYFDGCC